MDTEAYDLETDDCGNVYVALTGPFAINEVLTSTAQEEPSPETHYAEFVGWILKLDALGDLKWKTGVGAGDYAFVGSDMDVDEHGNVYATGTGEDLYSMYYESMGYAAKISQPFASEEDTLVIVTCESYTSPSGLQTWTSSGMYQDTLGSGSYCEQILTIDLTITPPVGAPILIGVDTTLCPGDTYVSPSNTHQWTTSGTYADTIYTLCDTIIYGIQLQFNGDSDTTIVASDCNSFLLNNIPYTTTGIYTQLLANQERLRQHHYN